jgi:CHAD domain-containing protein
MNLENLRHAPAEPREPAAAANASDFAGREPRPAVRPFAPKDTMLQLVYHNLDRQLAVLGRELHTATTRGITVESVHALRTALRRIRALLRIFRRMLPKSPRRRLNGEIAWLARKLGAVRDLDVQCVTIERDRQAEASSPGDQPPQSPDDQPPQSSPSDVDRYLRRLIAERDVAAARVLQTLQGSRVQSLLAEFRAFLDREPSAAAVRRWSDLDAVEGARDFSIRALRRVRKLGRRVARDAGSPDRMHDLRIRCKRFRYLLESLAPICGDRLHRAIGLTRRLQETLGDYQDARVAIRRLDDEIAVTGGGESSATGSTLAIMRRAREQDAGAAAEAFRQGWREFEAGVTKRRVRKRIRAAPPRSVQ